MMRVLVCGGRDYGRGKPMSDKVIGQVRRFIETLDALHAAEPITYLIEGGAAGADLLAQMWAKEHDIGHCQFHADWKTHGRAAGPIRNKQMLDEGKPDMVIAFPGGRGTANMAKQARAAGVRVLEPLNHQPQPDANQENG